MRRPLLTIRVLPILGLVAIGLGALAAPAAAVVFIPAGATVTSATLSLYDTSSSNETVQVRRVTAPWTETGVTWNSFGGAYDPALAGSFVAAGGGRSGDVTSLVQGWMANPPSNYGI